MFCAQCGKGLPASAKFCPACGAVVAVVGTAPTEPVQASIPLTDQFTGQPKARSTPLPGTTPGVAPNRTSAEMLAFSANLLVWPLIGICIAAVLELGQMSRGNSGGFLGFLIDGASAVALYVFGYQGLKAGKVQQAKQICGVLAILAGLSAVLAFSAGVALAFGLDLGICASLCFFLFWANTKL